MGFGSRRIFCLLRLCTTTQWNIFPCCSRLFKGIFPSLFSNLFSSPKRNPFLERDIRAFHTRTQQRARVWERSLFLFSLFLRLCPRGAHSLFADERKNLKREERCRRWCTNGTCSCSKRSTDETRRRGSWQNLHSRKERRGRKTFTLFVVVCCSAVLYWSPWCCILDFIRQQRRRRRRRRRCNKRPPEEEEQERLKNSLDVTTTRTVTKMTRTKKR